LNLFFASYNGQLNAKMEVQTICDTIREFAKQIKETKTGAGKIHIFITLLTFIKGENLIQNPLFSEFMEEVKKKIIATSHNKNFGLVLANHYYRTTNAESKNYSSNAISKNFFLIRSRNTH
jgi:hypothetical protein